MTALAEGVKRAGSVNKFPGKNFRMVTTQFGLQMSPGFMTVSLSDAFTNYVNRELGGATVPPRDHYIDFDFVRNFSERPVLNPATDSFIQKDRSGLRYVSSGNLVNDHRIINALGSGLERFGVNLTNLATPGSTPAP